MSVQLYSPDEKDNRTITIVLWFLWATSCFFWGYLFGYHRCLVDIEKHVNYHLEQNDEIYKKAALIEAGEAFNRLIPQETKD